MRLLVYSDCVYHGDGENVYGEIAFSRFIAGFADTVEQLTIVGRLDPEPGRSHYRLPHRARFVAVPHYDSLTQPLRVIGSLLHSLRRFWGAVGETDVVWLFGPYAHALLLALIATMRRRPVVLGVRQDFPVYVRSRRPNQRWMHLAADALEGAWRLLARRMPVFVVGAQLAENYRRFGRVMEMTVSLIDERDISHGRSSTRSFDAPRLQLLSVGRVDEEKNPLLLADILAKVRADDPRWELVVCGDGPLLEPLAERFQQLRLADHATLMGYLPFDQGLMAQYRDSHVFLHVSRTEGMPQVLLEAFAAGLPVVATAVGGVGAAADGAAILIAPDSVEAAAEAVQKLASEPMLRERLIHEGFRRAEAHTLDAEVRRVVGVLAKLTAVPGSSRPEGARAKGSERA